MMKLLVIGLLVFATGCTTTAPAKELFSGTFVGTVGTTTKPANGSNFRVASMRPDFPIAGGFVVYESLHLLLSPEQVQMWPRLSGHRVSVTCTVQQGSLFGADSLFCHPTRVALEP